MKRYKLHFHDFIYGRINFWTTSEGSDFRDAADNFLKDVQMPNYVINNYAELIEQ